MPDFIEVLVNTWGTIQENHMTARVGYIKQLKFYKNRKKLNTEKKGWCLKQGDWVLHWCNSSSINFILDL